MKFPLGLEGIAVPLQHQGFAEGCEIDPFVSGVDGKKEDDLESSEGERLVFDGKAVEDPLTEVDPGFAVVLLKFQVFFESVGKVIKKLLRADEGVGFPMDLGRVGGSAQECVVDEAKRPSVFGKKSPQVGEEVQGDGVKWVDVQELSVPAEGTGPQSLAALMQSGQVVRGSFFFDDEALSQHFFKVEMGEVPTDGKAILQLEGGLSGRRPHALEVLLDGSDNPDGVALCQLT